MTRIVVKVGFIPSSNVLLISGKCLSDDLLPSGTWNVFLIETISIFVVGYGVTANIAASHAAARGSIPRIRVLFASR